MAQQTDQDFYYYLTFRAVGSFYMARLNGATFSDQSRVRRHEFAVPINLYLQPGENVLEFIFVPGWGEEWALGEPNPEFAMFASLMELNLQTRAERNFGIANVSFDMERGEVVPREMTSLGPSQPAGTADFGRVGPMEVSNGTYTDIHGPPLEARVLRFRFNVPSELPAFPWADAPPLQDSMTLRTELAAAYERVHNATSAGDFASIQRAFEPAWTHASQAMAYDSMAEFLEAGGQEKAFVPVREDGNTLGPLSFLPSLKDVRLEIMDDGKLVRFDPAPLHWVQPGDPPKRAFSSHIAFYRGADGGLKIGSVLLGL